MPQLRRREVRSRRGHSRGWWFRRLVALAAGILLLGLLGWWWRKRAAPPQPPKSELPSPSTFSTNTLLTLSNLPPTLNKLATNLSTVPGPAPTPPTSSVPLNQGVDRQAKAASWLHVQLALVSRGISPGSIDGVGGAQTTEAVRAFQMNHRLEANGRLDRETTEALSFTGPPITEFRVTAAHLARIHSLPTSWLGKSEIAVLDYESLVELVGEASQTHPGFLRWLNPNIDWDHPREGMRLSVPAAVFPPARRAALIRVSLAGKWVRAFDENGRLLAHFPCSIAARMEKRPVGGLAVAVVVKDPNYTFDPAMFPESSEARRLDRKLVLNPGPNNPVGVAWIGLDRPGYGIHGTPAPEKVGRTESHGCFRLANWNAEYLRQMCWVGLRVNVER